MKINNNNGDENFENENNEIKENINKDEQLNQVEK